MSALTIHYRPELRDPVLIIAFLGWNDASESATSAVRHLRRRSRTKPFAEIDPDEFFVFSEHRPLVRLLEGRTREIRWPRMDFTALRVDDSEHDLILGIGTEPDLKWKTFASLLIEFADQMNVHEIFTLGALLADTPHTRPVPLSGGASSEQRSRELGFQPSNYEGPTGIVGALSDACRLRNVPYLSLWASVPHYVSGGQNPRATQALLRRVTEIYDLGFDFPDLDARSRRYEAQVTEALQRNPEMQDYVDKLEESGPDDQVEDLSVETEPGTPISSSDVLDEIDRLLRGDEGDGS